MQRNRILIGGSVLALAAGVLWHGAARPVEAQRLLAISRAARVDGRTVGDVVVNKTAALRFFAGAGNLSAVERADVVAGRLNELDEQRALKSSDIRVGGSGGAVTLTARETTLVTVLPEDARPMNLSVREAADVWVENLADALEGKEVPAGALLGRRESPEPAPARRDDREALRNERGDDRESSRRSRDRDDETGIRYDPDLKTKLVPIISVGSNLSVGVAQVQGEERDVEKVKVVAQLETDYKDRARIKILVPVQSKDVVKHIDRVPGVSVSAVADYTF